MQTCKVCGVEIFENKVNFHYGKPGTRDRLYARVCQYTEKPGCINKIADFPDLKPVKNDFYQNLPELCP